MITFPSPKVLTQTDSPKAPAKRLRRHSQTEGLLQLELLPPEATKLTIYPALNRNISDEAIRLWLLACIGSINSPVNAGIAMLKLGVPPTAYTAHRDEAIAAGLLRPGELLVAQTVESIGQEVASAVTDLELSAAEVRFVAITHALCSTRAEKVRNYCQVPRAALAKTVNRLSDRGYLRSFSNGEKCVVARATGTPIPATVAEVTPEEIKEVEKTLAAIDAAHRAHNRRLVVHVNNDPTAHPLASKLHRLLVDTLEAMGNKTDAKTLIKVVHRSFEKAEVIASHYQTNAGLMDVRDNIRVIALHRHFARSLCQIVDGILSKESFDFEINETVAGLAQSIPYFVGGKLKRALELPAVDCTATKVGTQLLCQIDLSNTDSLTRKLSSGLASLKDCEELRQIVA